MGVELTLSFGAARADTTASQSTDRVIPQEGDEFYKSSRTTTGEESTQGNGIKETTAPQTSTPLATTSPSQRNAQLTSAADVRQLAQGWDRLPSTEKTLLLINLAQFIQNNPGAIEYVFDYVNSAQGEEKESALSFLSDFVSSTNGNNAMDSIITNYIQSALSKASIIDRASGKIANALMILQSGFELSDIKKEALVADIVSALEEMDGNLPPELQKQLSELIPILKQQKCSPAALEKLRVFLKEVADYQDGQEETLRAAGATDEQLDQAFSNTDKLRTAVDLLNGLVKYLNDKAAANDEAGQRKGVNHTDLETAFQQKIENGIKKEFENLILKYINQGEKLDVAMDKARFEMMVGKPDNDKRMMEATLQRIENRDNFIAHMHRLTQVDVADFIASFAGQMALAA